MPTANFFRRSDVLTSYDILPQNYLGLQQNLHVTALPYPIGSAFQNPNFRRPRNPISPPGNRGTIGPKFVSHPRRIEHGVWGLEYERDVAGCDVYHERGFQGLGKSDDRFYFMKRNGLDETERLLSRIK